MHRQDTIFDLMRSRLPGLTRTQRVLAEFALRDSQSMALSTVTELAEQTGASPASIVRFAKELGFGGFNGLQRELRRSLRADLAGPDRFRRAPKPGGAADNALGAAIAQEERNIAALRDQHDPEALGAAVRMLADASRIVVIGSRSTASLAGHLCFGLTKAGLEAEPAQDPGFAACERIARLDARGCAVVIGFPRYLSGLVALTDAARAQGRRLLVITDSPFSPLRGDVTLHAPVESASFVAFHAAPTILIAALISGVAAERPERSLKALQDFEDLAKEQGLFLPGASDRNN